MDVDPTKPDALEILENEAAIIVSEPALMATALSKVKAFHCLNFKKVTCGRLDSTLQFGMVPLDIFRGECIRKIAAKTGTFF